MNVENRQRIVEQYLGGMSTSKIGMATGLGAGRVHRLLLQAGVKLRGRHERLPFPVERLAIPSARLAELYRDGASIERVAAQAGVSSYRATQLLRGMGVAIRTRPPKQGAQLSPETIAARYRAGASAGELAEAAGIKVAEVRALLVASGEELRPPLGHAQGRLDDRRFPPEKIEQLYEEGATVQSLAKLLGVSRELIRTLLLKRGVKLRGRGGRLPSAEPGDLVAAPDEVARRYRAGQGIAEIAASVGETAWQVRTVLLKLGVQLRGRAGNRDDELKPPLVPAEEVAKLYAEGLGLEPVAARAGVSRKKVRRLLREQRVPVRGRAEAMRQPAQARRISDRAVARRYRAGATLDALAIAAGSTVPVIRRILADQGVALRPKLVPMRLSEEQIASRYRAGSSLAQLAAEAGCSSLYPIRRILQRAGVPFRGKTDLNVQRGARPQLTEEAMQVRYEAGSSLSQIAAVANIHPARVATILHRRGVKLRRRGATRLADTERIKILPERMVELYLAGSTLEQIAVLAGSNRDRIADILRRRGVSIRRR